ncbi:MAG: HipA domain-containing protein [Bryobacteraceae bacterium]|jgi:serine/threonine-protein kinase HipA
MTVRSLETVSVFVDVDYFDAPALMGALRCQKSRTGDIFSFEYDPAWLQKPEAFSFDPDLALVSGPQYPVPGRANFGIFLDSSPDRWGRVLMQKRENIRARHEGRRARSLTEWDFLLGVHDETRLGALRFRDPETGQFIDTNDAFAAPPIASLRELQAASLQFELHGDEEEHAEYEEWLTMLFASGTSLGGARPKASIRDEAGALCLAKFPSRQDRRDVGAWEIVAHRLAAKAGITVPDARALRMPDSAYTTFLVRRFDRTSQGRRLAFVSAMTLTQRNDGEAGASYLELVDLLQSRGSNTHNDCVELFRRVVFSILIHNTDDHLRNHGFFIGERGISLSPAYDINPSNDRNELSLAINEVDTTCDVSIALEAAADYGLSKSEVDETVARATAAVTSWREEATRLRIPKAEQDLMAAAFESAA